MKKLIVGLMTILTVTVFAGSIDQTSITLDVSADPQYTDTVRWYGGAGAFVIPARDSSNIVVQFCSTDLGMYNAIDGIGLAKYKLMLNCGATAAATVIVDSSLAANNFNATDTTDNFTENSDPNGYSFDLAAGTNVTFTKADDGDFDALTTTSFVIGGWLTHDDISVAADTFFNKRDGTGNTETGYCAQMNSAGKYTFYRSDDGGATSDLLVGDDVLDDNTRNFVMFQCEGGTTLQLYVNGADGGSTVVSSAALSIDNAAAIFIGGTKAATEMWDGHMDDVFFISGDYFTAGEASDMYTRVSGSASAIQGLILDTGTAAGYLPFEGILSGNYGYLRLKYSAVQTADEVSTMFYEER